MIIGSGIDIVTVSRLTRLVERRGERALRRLFTPAELDYCLGLARSDPSLAARFAAKEAFFKAIGTGYGKGGRWTDVEVVRTPSGRPRLRLRGRAARIVRRLRVRRIHVSLSHTTDTAVASVLLEG